MRINILVSNKRRLVNGGAVLLLAGLAAGCSSQVARFNSVDDVFTASTSNQQQVINGSQPYPGDNTQVASVPAASSGTVSRSSLTPVTAQPLPAPTVAQAAPSQLPPPAAPASRAPVVAAAQPAPVVAQPQPVAAAKPVQAAPANGTPFQTAGTAPTPTNRPGAAPAQQQTVAHAPAAVQPAAATGYTVASGDTLNAVAKKNGVSVAALKQANNLQDGGLKMGQKLVIPSATAATTTAAAPVLDKVKTASTTPPAAPAQQAAQAPVAEPSNVTAYTPPKKEKLVEQASLEPADAPDATGIGKMRWPVRGRVISSYGKGSGAESDGIDIAVPEGTPVKAAENGVVIYAGNGLKEFGNTVLVRHEDGLVTVYGHTSEIKVQRGQKVKRGDDIALSGMSGTTDAPKLHFEVRKNSAPVDPSSYLQ